MDLNWRPPSVIDIYGRNGCPRRRSIMDVVLVSTALHYVRDTASSKTMSSRNVLTSYKVALHPERKNALWKHTELQVAEEPNRGGGGLLDSLLVYRLNYYTFQKIRYKITDNSSYFPFRFLYFRMGGIR